LFTVPLEMLKNNSQLITGIVIGFVAGFLVAKLAINNSNTHSNPTNTNPKQNTERRNNNDNNNSNTTTDANTSIPQKVFDVLKYIKANNQAMDGYVGGREFTNREKVLPQQDAQGNDISYQEWDVNRKVQGQNRGTERICTGSDGRSWYTNDHYRTFTEIK
jgi:ribonuclease T1